MGPKGYRICWLGRSREKLFSILGDRPETLGEVHFLPYPESDREQLRQIHPSFFVIDTEQMEACKKDFLQWACFCREVAPRAKVLFLVHNGSPGAFSEGLRNGADWILPGVEDHASLKYLLLGLISHHKTEKEVLHAVRKGASGQAFEGMIGSSTAMKDLFRSIQRCAKSKANVLIRGESGTGKELVADAVHRLSGRRGHLVVTNCASLMDTLHQSELFGHEKGAFTDAKSRRLGYFEVAKGGSLFLDEIGDISTQTQVTLLRVIEGREFFRVGGWEPIQVDVRIISATNQDLERRVKDGRFREDLYYRLNGFCLRVPPLRERKEDVPLLAGAFLNRFSEREGKSLTGFTPEAMDLLTTYPWPGNVRELENEIQRIVIQTDTEKIISSDMLVPPINILKNLPSYRSAVEVPLKVRVQQAEAFYIKEELKSHYGNRTRTARFLGISREGLHKKMARYQIR